MINLNSLRDYYDACGDLRLDFDGDLDTKVRQITCDSRDVTPGSLFVAIRGTREDGCDYIPQAIYKGAVGVVYKKDRPLRLPIPSFRVDDDYGALGKIAAFHFGYPASGMTTIGVTGTNGKTTTSFLLRSIFKKMGIKTGLLGSVHHDTGNRIVKSDMTTPSPIRLQKLLNDMKKSGVKLVIMEVSSHALVQKRLGNLCFDVGIFTNLTAEHLDYHVTIENYYDAKKLLFLKYLKPGASAIINTDDSYGKRLVQELLAEGLGTDTFVENPKYPTPATQQNLTRNHKIQTYGFDISSHCHPRECDLSLTRTVLSLQLPKGNIDLNLSLIGVHNVYNIMASVCAAMSLEVPFSHITEGVEHFNGVSGRLQQIANDSDINVFIDYAHTEDALEKVLQALRPHCKGRLILVFGCGGGRDKSKRSGMGRIASRFSSEIIVTSDNPRWERPESIINDIMKGIPLSVQPCRAVVSRRDAIFAAISKANPGDTVLVAGKGHEEYQEVNNRKLKFSDLLVCQEALGKRKGFTLAAV